MLSRSMRNVVIGASSVLQQRMDFDGSEPHAAAERDELDDERASHGLPPGLAAGPPHDLQRAAGGPARREQIVDDEDAAAVAERVLMNLQTVAAVLEVVARLEGGRRQFPRD